MTTSREGLFVNCILVTAVAVRLFVAVVTTSWIFSDERHSWEFGYEMGQIAASIAEGRGFSWPPWSSRSGATAWMPPVYPFIMAFFFEIFGVFTQKAALALIFFQTVVSTITCYIAYLLGKRVFNVRAGLVAALLLALYPPAIHFAAQKIWSTTLFTFCLLVLALFVIRIKNQPEHRYAIGLGLLIGLTSLIDPIVITSFPFIVVWLYRKSTLKHVIVVKQVAIASILLLITITPWLIRNYLVFGKYVFLKSNFGNELYLGNNPYADGSFSASAVREILESRSAQLLSLDEPSRNRILLGEAMRFIAENPGRFIRLTVARILHYWTFMMRPVESTLDKAILTIYFGLLVIGVLGIIAADLRVPASQVLLLFILSLPLPYYFTVVGLFRYRLPVEIFIIMFAGFAVSRMFDYGNRLISR